MDERVELMNRISQDILDMPEIPFEAVQRLVNEYADLLEPVIRNFYEVQTMGEEAPLFQLCYYLKHGKDNFGFEDEEFNAEVKSLKTIVEKMFGVDVEDM